MFVLHLVLRTRTPAQPRIRKQAGVLLGTCINILRPDSDVSPASPVGHILGFALKGLRSSGFAHGGPNTPLPTGTGMSTTSNGSGSGGGGGGQSASEVLLGSLQIFENLYSARAMWMSPTYAEVCEMILRLQGHRDPAVRAAVVHVLPTCARYDFVRFTGAYLRQTMRFYLDIWTRGSGDRSQGASVLLSGCAWCVLTLGSRVGARGHCWRGQYRDQELYRRRAQDRQGVPPEARDPPRARERRTPLWVHWQPCVGGRAPSPAPVQRDARLALRRCV